MLAPTCRDLLAGELRTGQFVSQRELTDLPGATLNPVREAIRKLEAEGLINVYAQRGIQIVEAGPKAINDSYDYRLLLETNALKLLIARADAETIEAMARNVEASLEAPARSPKDRKVRVAALDADYQFHKDLIDFQKNEIISKHYSLNAARFRLFWASLGEPLQRLEVAGREHLEVLDACRAGDAGLAVARLAEHIQVSREHTRGVRPMPK
ncbi:MAG: GntR family transcriptional regulator [Reyranellaceae bacterium]